MRGRLGLAAVALLLGVVGVAALLLTTGGDDASADGGTVLAWQEEPLLITPETLPDDRIVYGTVRNTSLERLRAPAEDFTVRDASGRELAASIQFIDTYAHGLYGAFQQPDNVDVMELSRLGYVSDLETGQTSPLTVSYRFDRDSEPPAALYYRGVEALELPDAAK